MAAAKKGIARAKLSAFVTHGRLPCQPKNPAPLPGFARFSISGHSLRSASPIGIPASVLHNTGSPGTHQDSPPAAEAACYIPFTGGIAASTPSIGAFPSLL
jgi:hypothetical protein